MIRRLLYFLCTAFIVAGSGAAAGSVDVTVTDASGKPAANAVIALVPESGAALASRLPEKAVIGQRHETFIPLVVVVRRGGSVLFTNNDQTMHQVYSFSPVKQFEFVISPGEVSKPVLFDKAGVAAIGCNIHDSMVAFVYVGDAPRAVITDANGHGTIADVPDGTYRVSAWHPQLPAGASPDTSGVTVANGAASLTLSLPVMAMPMPTMRHMHQQNY